MFHFCLLVVGVFYRLYKGKVFVIQKYGILALLNTTNIMALFLDFVGSLAIKFGVTL
jgi:hypothetical protein